MKRKPIEEPPDDGFPEGSPIDRGFRYRPPRMAEVGCVREFRGACCFTYAEVASLEEAKKWFEEHKKTCKAFAAYKRNLDEKRKFNERLKTKT